MLGVVTGTGNKDRHWTEVQDKTRETAEREYKDVEVNCWLEWWDPCHWSLADELLREESGVIGEETRNR